MKHESHDASPEVRGPPADVDGAVKEGLGDQRGGRTLPRRDRSRGGRHRHFAIDDPIWVPTAFTKNRDRLLAGNLSEAVFAGVERRAERRQLLSHDHFTVDGTLLEAWASQKSPQPIARAKDREHDDDDRADAAGRA